MGNDMHRRHLAEADRHVAKSLALIATQRALVERLEGAGLDASDARRVLTLFEETLRLMQAHRELIVRALR